MKRILLALALLANVLNVFAQAPEYLPEWKEGYLDIHTIATGRGDADSTDYRIKVQVRSRQSVNGGFT